MKYVKEKKVEVEITEELIQYLNAEFAEDGEDFHDHNLLKTLLNELITLPVFGMENFTSDAAEFTSEEYWLVD